jgi:hypothetical protein
MALPNAVLKQAQAADAAIAALNTPENTADATPGIDAQAAPAPANTGIPAEPPTPEVREPEQGDFEHRFKVLQGKYNAEVPKLNQVIRDLRDQLQKAQESQPAGNDAALLQQLRDEIGNLKQQLQSAQQQQAKPVQAPELDTLRSEFGADLIDGLLAHVQKMVAPVQQKLETVDQKTQKSEQDNRLESGKAQMRAALKPAGLDFDAMNNDAAFGNWLKERDTLSGQVRGQLLNNAFWNGDYSRASLFFTEFAHANRQSDGRANPAGLDLSQHVSVGSGAPADGNRGNAPVNVWTPQAIEQFYRDKQRNKYTPADAARLEAEIFAALANNAG